MIFGAKIRMDAVLGILLVTVNLHGTFLFALTNLLHLWADSDSPIPA